MRVTPNRTTTRSGSAHVEEATGIIRKIGHPRPGLCGLGGAHKLWRRCFARETAFGIERGPTLPGAPYIWVGHRRQWMKDPPSPRCGATTRRVAHKTYIGSTVEMQGGAGRAAELAAKFAPTSRVSEKAEMAPQPIGWLTRGLGTGRDRNAQSYCARWFLARCTNAPTMVQRPPLAGAAAPGTAAWPSTQDKMGKRYVFPAKPGKQQYAWCTVDGKQRCPRMTISSLGSAIRAIRAIPQTESGSRSGRVPVLWGRRREGGA